MFIHFGLYSLLGGVWKGVPMGRNGYAEWIQVQGNWPEGISAEEYQALAAKFNPVAFDAADLAKQARDAGMGYVVLTSKHHDGFALWPSRHSAFNCQSGTPFRRDIVGEVGAACRHAGLRFGLYYSHWLDWEHPGGGRPHPNEGFTGNWSSQPTQEEFAIYWQNKCLPQVRELAESYSPDLFWFDTWCPNSSSLITEQRMDELIETVRSPLPDCLINSRIGV